MTSLPAQWPEVRLTLGSNWTTPIRIRADYAVPMYRGVVKEALLERNLKFRVKRRRPSGRRDISMCNPSLSRCSVQLGQIIGI
jgi:hypothetical protein